MQFNSKEMTMLKKLMLTLILGMIMSGPAAPILKSFLSIGSTAAYAADATRMAILREKTETESSTGNSRQLQ
jgi:hypothetical protein